MDKTGISFLEGVKFNSNIKQISLDRNPVSYGIILEISKYIIKNISLKKQLKTPNYIKKVRNLKKYESQKIKIKTEEYDLNNKKNNLFSEFNQTHQQFQMFK